MESNRFFLILSFFLTVMLFVYVKMDQIRTVPVDFIVRIRASEDVIVIPRDSVVKVYIRDRVRNILPLLFSRRYLEIPIKGKRVGNVMVDLKKVVRKSLDYPYVSIEPESLEVFVEKYRRVRREVSPRIKGTPPEGYRIEDVIVRPAFVEVRAPEGILNGIQFVETEDIDVSSVKGVDTFRVALINENKTVEIYPDTVEIILKTRRMEGENIGNPAGSRKGK